MLTKIVLSVLTLDWRVLFSAILRCFGWFNLLQAKTYFNDIFSQKGKNQIIIYEKAFGLFDKTPRVYALGYERFSSFTKSRSS